MTGAQDQASVLPVTKPVTYEELTLEHKQKYDEAKAQFEADLIGSFERTCNHGIRWKGFSPEGALDNVDLSVPSEERTRALRQEMNYMVAHTLHRHSESLVNELERVAHRVVQEVIKNQYSPSGPVLRSQGGKLHCNLGRQYRTRSRHQDSRVRRSTSSTRSAVTPGRDSS